MLYLLKHYALLLAVRGAMAVLFGIVALTSTEQMLFGLALLFSALMLMDGIHTLFTGIALNPDYDGWWAPVLEGGAGTLLGLLVLLLPNITWDVMVYLVAAWVLITGLFEVAAGLELRRIVGGEWLMILCGILTLLFGAMLFAFPGQAAVSLLWMTGIYTVVSGSTRIIDAFRLHSLPHLFETAST